MTNEWEDYYKTLQVHFMADSEAIRSAYLRLSKKYHPDNNNSPSSQEKMKSINKAYEILRKPESRNEYAMKWVDQYSQDKDAFKDQATTRFFNRAIEPVKNVLLMYLSYISKSNYQSAYQLLSKEDQKNISSKQFDRWQTLVAEIFELISYECDFHNMFKEIKVNNCYFETCIRMHVKVVEKNHLMGRIEEDSFYKNVVYEGDLWRIYLGHNNLKGIIEKFYVLASLKKKKNKSIGSMNTMQRNRNDFFEKAQREQARYNRYGNIFTLVLCETKECYIEEVNQVLTQVLRRLDIACRYNKYAYLILLPETNEKSAQRVAKKIEQSLKEKINSNNYLPITFKMIEQQHDNLEDLLNAIIGR